MNVIVQEEVPCASFGAAGFGCVLESNSIPLPPAVRMNDAVTKLKVLIADDEQMIANTLAVILNRSGFEARAVYSGKAAVDAADGFAPDLLISDVMMPGMTGIEAAIAIVAQRPECRVVLFSGQATTVNLLEEARQQGHHFEVLPKPMHPTTLLGKLRVAASR